MSPFTGAAIEAVVKNSGARQIYAPRATYPGKIVFTAPDTRWAADTVHMVSQPEGDFKYILTVPYIFTRELSAKALKTNRPAEVAQKFDEIVASHGIPRSPTRTKGAN